MISRTAPRLVSPPIVSSARAISGARTASAIAIRNTATTVGWLISRSSCVPSVSKARENVSRSRGSGKSAGSWKRLARALMQATRISCLLPTRA